MSGRQSHRVSLKMTGGGDGDAANPGPRKGSADAGRRIAVHLDDRPALDDDLFFDAALQSARLRKLELRRAGEFPLLSHRSGLSDLATEYAGPGRFRARDHHPARRAV